MNDKGTYNILIIEPSDPVRLGLAEILKSIEGVAKIDQVNVWEDFVSGIENINYDVVLLNPFACCRGPRLRPQVLEKFSNTVLIGIVTSIYDRDLHQDYHDMIYLTDKEERIRELVFRHLTSKSENQPVHQLLSEREIEVLKLFARGLATKEVADMLNISSHTVISHKKNITSKLGIKTASGMAIYAVTAKIIDASEILNNLPKKGG